MFTKILSSILASLMLLLSSIVPGFTPKQDKITIGEFVAMVDEAYGYLKAESSGPILGVAENDMYYEAVATAAEYEILGDFETIDTQTYSDVDFVSTVLVNASNIDTNAKTVLKHSKEFTHWQKVIVAMDAGIIDANPNIRNKAMNKNDIKAAIDKSRELSLTINQEKDIVKFNDDVKVIENYEIVNNAFVIPEDVEISVGDTCVFTQSADSVSGTIIEVQAVEADGSDTVITKSTPADLEEAIDKIDYEGHTDVDLTTTTITTADGQVFNNSFETAGLSKEDIVKQLKKLANVSFSVEGFNIKAKITDTGLDFSIAKAVCSGMTLSKSYSLTNLSVDARADINVSKLNFNDVYLLCDYDLTDKTAISGSYAKTFGDEYISSGEKLSSDKKVAELVNKYALSKLDSKSIKLFTFTLPLGSTPLTVTFDVMLNIDVNGKLTVTVISHETHGVQIINNKVSIINDSKVIDRNVNAYGNFEATLGLDVSLGLYGYALVDLGVEGGVGASVDATLRLVDENGNVLVNSTYTVPVDYIVEMCAGLDFDGKAEIGGHADIYGILKISVGEHSVLDKIGLSKTWTIFDENNAQFAHVDF